MKKIIGISSVFLGLGLIVSLIVGFCLKPGAAVPSSATFIYKLCTGIEFFLKYLPSFIITGFVVACSVHFGQNSEGSFTRFSHAMTIRYRSIMIVAISIAAILTLGNELLGLGVSNKKKAIVNQPRLINDYIKVGNQLYENGYYKRALVYADAALKLNPGSRDAARLADKADVALNSLDNTNIRIRLADAAKTEMDIVEKVQIDPHQIAEVYKYYLMAKDCFEKAEWFNAHYYAETAINIASPKDPNLEELKKLSSTAWKNISDTHRLRKSDDQVNFDKKYEGYLALVNKDDLKAYYIFRELYQTSLELAKDPDVNFYLDIAENRVSNRFFFIDETFELKTFESANDVYFSYNYKDGTKDILYFKGVTNVKSTGKSIQYLRDLTIESISKSGEHYRTLTVPYAKVLPVDVRPMHETTKDMLGIDKDTKFVPYLMLKSVGRDFPDEVIEPTYAYASGEVAHTPEYILLPMAYQDFTMLENANSDPAYMPITSLFKMVTKAEDYGYSNEMYGQVLLDRLFYPLWIIVLFVLLAAFGWNTRMNPNQYFKTSWVWSFPFFILCAHGVYKIAMFVFKLMNYVLISAVGVNAALWSGLILYIVWLIVISVYFLARQAKN